MATEQPRNAQRSTRRRGLASAKSKTDDTATTPDQGGHPPMGTGVWAAGGTDWAPEPPVAGRADEPKVVGRADGRAVTGRADEAIMARAAAVDRAS